MDVIFLWALVVTGRSWQNALIEYVPDDDLSFFAQLALTSFG